LRPPESFATLHQAFLVESAGASGVLTFEAREEIFYMALSASKDSLYSRLGGYDAIAAVVDDLLPRIKGDARLSRFWASPRSTDSDNRERQLAVDFIAAAAGGPNYYLGRDMKTSHQGMGISDEDYAAFKHHLEATLAEFEVPEQERSEVMAFVSSLAGDIIES
jgi:hemoglobin